MFERPTVFDRMKDWFGGHRIYVPYRNPYYDEKSTHELSYPPAAQSRKMTTRGKYRFGFPEGAVIHFNAGREDPKKFLNYMRGMGYTTLLIDRQAHVWQDFPLDEWGFHAGKSDWNEYKETVNDYFIGIEVMSAGVLKRMKNGEYKSWFNTIIPSNEVRYREGKYYHIFTEDQEKQLSHLLVWLEKAGRGVFKFNNVVGHHEVSYGRKFDPGGSLSMSMHDYREHLKSLS